MGKNSSCRINYLNYCIKNNKGIDRVRIGYGLKAKKPKYVNI